jgi:hypothetical protein
MTAKVVVQVKEVSTDTNNMSTTRAVESRVATLVSSQT